MNQPTNRNASAGRFCSTAELIEPTGSLRDQPARPLEHSNGKPHSIKSNGNGNLSAAAVEMVVALASSPAPGDGDRETFPENGRSESARGIEQSIAFMREHLDQPLPVAKLAALANVSPSHFFALFKRRTGCAPMDYFTHLRMQHACRLLDTTTASVKEVAAVLGYDDPFYFSRVFKLVNHVPPSQYRMLRKRSPDAGQVSTPRITAHGNESQRNDRIARSIKENLCHVK